MGSLFKEKGEFVPDKLIASNTLPIFAEGILLASGQGKLKRGTLIGKSDEKGYITGSTLEENVIGVTGILTDDIDTGTETNLEGVVSTIYLTGVFNPEAFIMDETASLDTYKDAMRKLGIFTKNVQEYE
ncbi:hypothetical protein [Lachnotalea glycerini]|uniref:Head decoration protein n=1 Tax=Lachnotalea glycerini TaxID=1763509 RepID=A0A371JC87_9FIRM|nr:hypothetical protein [Lachnotalea glycerini]RDY30298.1 hypothetical protein CG710_015295 [Lachnotalea glycerini]